MTAAARVLADSGEWGAGWSKGPGRDALFQWGWPIALSGRQWRLMLAMVVVGLRVVAVPPPLTGRAREIAPAAPKPPNGWAVTSTSSS